MKPGKLWFMSYAFLRSDLPDDRLRVGHRVVKEHPLQVIKKMNTDGTIATNLSYALLYYRRVKKRELADLLSSGEAVPTRFDYKL